MSGPLAGIRVIELAHERSAFAGKLLADLGAEVIVVEPPGGADQRRYGPFVEDVAGPERSLWWWHYNTGKLGVVLDVADPGHARRWREIVGTADVVLEGEAPGYLASLAIDHDSIRADHPALVWVSVTPFGRSGPRSDEAATDLTLLAAAGSAWSCGYDDHTLPPVRGGGNQAYQTGCIFAVMAALTALLYRDVSGRGQFVDVNLHAASNVTTEAATYEWLVARATVQRQTGRHASPHATTFTRALSIDGIDVHSGFPPRRADDFRSLLGWLDELGLREDFPEAFFLEMGIERGELHLADIGRDPEVTAIFGAGRDALQLIASRITAYDFFVEGQRRGLAVGIIYAPEEVLADPHFIDRGFPSAVEHPELGRTVVYPGPPFQFPAAPLTIRRAPQLGEHQTLVFDRFEAGAS